MKHPKIPFLLAIATVALLIYGCILGPEREPCTGRLILENPIPDTTVAVGDTLFIDLANPPVFMSTEGRVTYATSVSQGSGVVDSNIKSNPNDNDNFTLLLISGESEGEGIIEIRAFSECLENQTTINVTVTEQ